MNLCEIQRFLAFQLVGNIMAIIFCMFISFVEAWVSVIYKLRQWTDIRIKAWSMKRDYRQSFGVLIRHCPVLYTPEFPIREHLHVTLEF